MMKVCQGEIGIDFVRDSRRGDPGECLTEVNKVEMDMRRVLD